MMVVVGDRVPTNGLLAWRLRATFLHVVLDDEHEERCLLRIDESTEQDRPHIQRTRAHRQSETPWPNPANNR
jgi:hypothetical protein